MSGWTGLVLPGAGLRHIEQWLQSAVRLAKSLLMSKVAIMEVRCWTGLGIPGVISPPPHHPFLRASPKPKNPLVV